MRIRWKLTWYGIGVTAGALLVFVILIILLVQGTAGEDQDQVLSSMADETAQALGMAPLDAFDAEVPPVLPDAETSNHAFTTAYDDAAVAVFATGQVSGSPLVLPASMFDEALNTGASEGTVDGIRVQARVWTNPDVGRGVVAAAQSIRVVEEQLVGIRGFLAAFGFIALFAAAFGAWFMAGRALKPLRDLAETTDEIGSTGDLTQRLPVVPRDDEVGHLASSFNAMLSSLEEARKDRDRTIEGQKRFVADASHELRSPLTSIAANAGFLLDHADADPKDRRDATEDIASAADRMADLIDRLITLAREEGGRSSSREPVDLRGVIDEVLERARSLDCVVESTVSSAVVVEANSEEIAEALWILVDNADRHGASHARISVDVGSAVELAVEDNGPGVPPDMREAVFDRFFRADPARSAPGYGLGLSIASATAAQHGGAISVTDGSLGGARFVLELPLMH